MRARQVLWTLICLVSALALTLAVSAGGAGASMHAAADQSWTDPAGDAQGGAPDLTGVQVSNDGAGTITMNVTVPLVADTAMFVFIDTDMNGLVFDATGRIIIAMGLEPGFVVPLVLDGEGDPAAIPSLRLNATATTVTLSFAKDDVGIDRGFMFWIASATLAQIAEGPGDELPDGDEMLSYILTTPPPPAPPAPVVVKPVISQPLTTPKAAVAGKRFTVRFTVTRSDNGKPLTTGKMICHPYFRGKAIRHAESFKRGTARMSFIVPKAAKGKQIKVKVTIRAGKQSATKVATFRVK